VSLGKTRAALGGKLSRVECPHCLVEFHPPFSEAFIQWDNGRGEWLTDADGYWTYSFTLCPRCKRSTIYLSLREKSHSEKVLNRIMVWPKGIARAPLPKEVPEKYVGDYREACLVLSDSPKASAALSRHCPQLILRDEVKVKPWKLHAEIDDAAKSGKLPPYISELLLDAVRHFGNFAANPEKDGATGEIIDVEPGEAEWSLDVVEALFDFCFVQPRRWPPARRHSTRS